MDIYAEIDQRRAERYARRQARMKREERRERVLAPIRYVIQIVLAVAVFYLYLFAACLWASM